MSCAATLQRTTDQHCPLSPLPLDSRFGVPPWAGLAEKREPGLRKEGAGGHKKKSRTFTTVPHGQRTLHRTACAHTGGAAAGLHFREQERHGYQQMCRVCETACPDRQFLAALCAAAPCRGPTKIRRVVRQRVSKPPRKGRASSRARSSATPPWRRAPSMRRQGAGPRRNSGARSSRLTGCRGPSRCRCAGRRRPTRGAP